MRTEMEGFTLLELMVVLALIGLLASLAVPSYAGARTQAKVGRTASELVHIAKAFMAYESLHAEYPPDSHRTLPDGMTDFLDQSLWDSETPLGGFYNWEGPDNYPYAGVSILSPTVSQEVLESLDRRIDDGDMSSGRFRYGTNGRPTLIIAE